MKLSRDICLGGRYNNKNITGIKLNGYVIYGVSSDFTFIFVTDVADEMPIKVRQGLQYCELDVETTERDDGLYTRKIEFVDKNYDKKVYVSIECSLDNQSIKRIEKLSGNHAAFKTMFICLSALEYADLSAWDTYNVTDMSGMFQSCPALTTLDVSNFDTSNVTNMSNMFGDCSALTALDLSDFNTSNVTDMNYMFYNCAALTALDLNNFDTSKVTSMNTMFYNCAALTTLDLSSFDTSKVTDMIAPFYGCSSLTTLNISNFDTSNVTNMARTFEGCNSLTELRLDNCSNSTIKKLITDFGFPTFTSGTHTIYCKQTNAEGLTAPKGWTFSYV